ncbi:DUF4421 family protein [Fulvivirga sp. 29W222]|uniref:DUF4421 family protein n=1 Tax=Fulvivirga marina TaxID=2494733 RepID=A0A937FTH5_9BACT|nr:DUF4421 domain-containing protein [Fulvivirga marina]MBL6445454.1 DUF4421 family protein [Fulvivirga marina]
MKKLLLLTVAMISLSGPLTAQTDSTTLVRETYIQEFPDRFYLKPILTVRNMNMRVEDKQRDRQSVEYEPINNTYLGLGLYMFNLGLELSFRLPSSAEDEEKYGETSAFDFQTNIYTKRWGADVAYQNYEGFYIKDPDEKFLEWKSDNPFIQREDLKIVNFQLNGFYMFNHEKFSYRSSYMQADKQKKSAGSFLLGTTFGIFKFSADSALMPASDQSPSTSEGHVIAGKFTTLGVLPGYAHNFVLKDFYLNLSLSAGPANIWTRSTTTEKTENAVKIRPVIGGRVAIGYNSEKFFCGFSMVTQSVSYGLDDIDVSGQTGNAKLFFGIRFLEKGVMKKNLF